MAREAPNPFGTSLIDLLVSGLAMVGMLWVMNAANNGLLGSGDEETASGLVRVSQFGPAHHMRAVTVRLPSSWTCTFELVWDATPTAAVDGCVTENGLAASDFPAAEDGRIAFHAPGAPDGVETIVLLRAETPGSAFFTNLTITVEKLVARDLQVDIGIVPCCDPNQPHYLRLQSFSGAGPSEILTYWHAAQRLAEVFDARTRLSGGAQPAAFNLATESWIFDLGDSLKSGQANPIRTLFDLQPGEDCSKTLQVSPYRTLGLNFEAEGEIQVRLPTPLGTSSQYRAMMANFDMQMASYLAWLDEVRP